MSIQRAPRPQHGYTLILDDVLRDSRLSYRARGVLAAILSRPDNWVTTAEQLAAEGKEGRDALRNALKELDDAGYVERRRQQVERGRWVTQTVVYDRPQATSSPSPENPSPVAGNPSPETDIQPSVVPPSVDQALRRTTEKNNQLQEPSSSPTADAADDQEPSTQPETSPKAADEPQRDDVDRLCKHLADRIEANGSKRPTITVEWRKQCRLLLDRDGREEHQVKAAIDWCQNDSFWMANIRSMPKLREQYDTLRLRAIEQSQQHVRGGQANQRQNRTNQVYDAAMERAKARDEAATLQPQGALTR